MMTVMISGFIQRGQREWECPSAPGVTTLSTCLRQALSHCHCVAIFCNIKIHVTIGVSIWSTVKHQ